jgi:hypothetical protein
MAPRKERAERSTAEQGIQLDVSCCLLEVSADFCQDHLWCLNTCVRFHLTSVFLTASFDGITTGKQKRVLLKTASSNLLMQGRRSRPYSVSMLLNNCLPTLIFTFRGHGHFCKSSQQSFEK